MRIIKYFFVITIFLCLFNSCTKGENELSIKLSRQDISLIELSSNIYSDDQLTNIMQFSGSMSELNTKYPFECVRKLDEGYRVAYLGDSSILIVILDESGNKILGNIHSVSKPKSDFNILSKGQLLESVQDFDPEGDYLFLYTGRSDVPKISTHYTNDGYIITIEYDNMNKISNIEIELI